MALTDAPMEIPGTTDAASKPQDPRPEMTLEDRIVALQSQTFRDVDTWLKLYGKKGVRRPFKSEEILAIITAFHAFSQEYRDELSKLPGPTSRNWLEASVDNALLDYWEPILRAAEHHRSDHYRALLEKAYTKLESMQKNLEERLKSRFDVNIVLYFERIGKAMRYPFGKTYLIGVPLIDAYREDWMAIPHELGHHLFWKIRFSESDTGPARRPGTNFLQAELDSAMQVLPLAEDDPARKAMRQLLDDWTEEIFADVAGARIAGSEFVEAGWHRVSRLVKEEAELYESDGDHPILYLLPYIRAAAAEITPEEKWDKLFGAKLKAMELVPNQNIRDNREVATIKLEDLRAAVEAYARKITARLKQVELDQLFQGPSSFAELKAFIQSMQEKEDSKVRIDNEDEVILKLLLKPVILTKGQEWTCRNGHRNSSSTSTCLTCGDGRNFWGFVTNLFNG